MIKNTWYTAQSKDRLNFYLGIADTALDVSDRSYHKFVVETVIVRTPLNAW